MIQAKTFAGIAVLSILIGEGSSVTVGETLVVGFSESLPCQPTYIIPVLRDRLGSDAKIECPQKGRLVVTTDGDGANSQLPRIRRLVLTQGIVELRYAACAADESTVAAAMQLPIDEKDVRIDGKLRANWAPYRVDEYGPLAEADPRIIKREGIAGPEALMISVQNPVLGEHLSAAQVVALEGKRFGLELSFNEHGVPIWKRLIHTERGAHPNSDGRYLGLLLDNVLVGGSEITAVDDDSIVVTGQAFAEDFAQDILTVLNCGVLPCPLHEVK